MFFEDWNDSEWQKFDNFMVYCTMQYLQKGLIPYKMINLERKMYINKVGIEFEDWTNDGALEENIRYFKNTTFENFLKDNPECKMWMRQKKFTQNVKHYCEYNKLKYIEGRENGLSYFEIIK